MTTLPHHVELLSDAWIEEAVGDWFDELSAQGRGDTRAAYMARLHEFTEKRKRLLLDGPARDD